MGIWLDIFVENTKKYQLNYKEHNLIMRNNLGILQWLRSELLAISIVTKNNHTLPIAKKIIEWVRHGMFFFLF